MDVYLCVKMKNNMNYKCSRFDDFVSADNHFKRNIKYSNEASNEALQSSTMIPVIRYIPIFLKKQYLQYQLSKIFCRTEL